MAPHPHDPDVKALLRVAVVERPGGLQPGHRRLHDLLAAAQPAAGRSAQHARPGRCAIGQRRLTVADGGVASVERAGSRAARTVWCRAGGPGNAGSRRPDSPPSASFMIGDGPGDDGLIETRGHARASPSPGLGRSRCDRRAAGPGGQDRPAGRGPAHHRLLDHAVLPGPNVTLHPDVILTFVIPPLIYSAALNSSLLAIRKNLRVVISLSIGLVLATSLAVGAGIDLFVPGVGLAAGVALGAAVAPTDPVAALAVGWPGRAARPADHDHRG